MDTRKDGGSRACFSKGVGLKKDRETFFYPTVTITRLANICQ